MATIFGNAEWIWCNDHAAPDEYGEFYTTFQWQGGKAELHIAADSNYAVYLNGTLRAFGQYHDYPYDKTYSSTDLSPYCQAGENSLAILVWHYGIGNMSYYPGQAALLFAILGETAPLCVSSRQTRARISPAYENHRQKNITSQLGFGFAYDATREDGWLQGEGDGFADATPVARSMTLRPRPCAQLIRQSPRPAALCKKTEDGAMILDLGTNTVGFLQLQVQSPVSQRLVISYGEHLADGRVRRMIGKRDFSVELTVRAGETSFLNPLRRLGCRYLEIHAQTPLTACKAAILPTVYPLSELAPPAHLTAAQKEIYSTCVNTLRLCMHEHYEDCPWREQALYCMDSRNQMLCGYYAFGETAFPRANLQLMSKDNRADGLLSICFPTDLPLCIPSFSLHYFTQCAEYLRYSGDIPFLRSIYPKLESILQAFISHLNADGLITPFEGEEYWNFYEWRKGLEGEKGIDLTLPDLPLNALLALALQRMAEIADALGISTDYRTASTQLSQAIAKHFFNPARGLFFDRTADSTYSVLGNALAVLCGAAADKPSVCAALRADDPALIPISLSMQCFLFDALLQVDPNGAPAYILEKIEQTYRPMIELGLGTVWETDRGQAAFGGAGSLCHGWSAMPIYYYHILKP